MGSNWRLVLELGQRHTEGPDQRRLWPLDLNRTERLDSLACQLISPPVTSCQLRRTLTNPLSPPLTHPTDHSQTLTFFGYYIPFIRLGLATVESTVHSRWWLIIRIVYKIEVFS